MARPSLTQDRAAIKPLPPTLRVELPESRGYRFKSKVLGRALNNDQLAHERLGKPTALAVFASDALSSTAYATEEILRTLLFFGAGDRAPGLQPTWCPSPSPWSACWSSWSSATARPSRPTPRPVAPTSSPRTTWASSRPRSPASSLLTDYILTVAVSTSAGVAALYSAVPALLPVAHRHRPGLHRHHRLGNLRGVKESGKVFAVPTYVFIVAMFVLIGTGLFKAAIGGGLHHVAPTVRRPSRRTGLGQHRR